MTVTFILAHKDGIMVLYGDGMHDDTDALQALANGADVLWPNGERAAWSKLRPGRYVVTRTIRVGKHDLTRGPER